MVGSNSTRDITRIKLIHLLLMPWKKLVIGGYNARSIDNKLKERDT
jgi:hypothetical protein